MKSEVFRDSLLDLLFFAVDSDTINKQIDKQLISYHA